MRVFLTRVGLKGSHTWHVVDSDKREIAFHTQEAEELIAALERMLKIAHRDEKKGG